MYAAQTQPAVAALPHLSLAGHCGYRVNNDRVIVTVDEIANHRDFGNVSGTLSIELWALKQPYARGQFNGIALAGTSIGEVLGQHYLSNCHYDLLFEEPVAGTWYLTLMLREWTEVGYVTRDYVNFPVPYVVAAKPRVVRSTADNVINVSFAGNQVGSPSASPVASPIANPVASPVASPAPSTRVSAAQPKAAVAEPAPLDRGDSPTSAAASLNDASMDEIAAVKGVSKKLAVNLVAARPFKSFEDVLAVKGIGAAMLKKLRQLFTL